MSEFRKREPKFDLELDHTLTLAVLRVRTLRNVSQLLTCNIKQYPDQLLTQGSSAHV